MTSKLYRLPLSPSPPRGHSSSRRDFLVSTAAALMSVAFARTGAAATDQGTDSAETRKLDQLLTRLFDERMREEPQSMTGLGLDVGAGEWAKGKLNDRSRSHVEHMIRLHQRWLKELARIDASKLSGLS